MPLQRAGMQPEAVGEKEPGVWGESNTLTSREPTGRAIVRQDLLLLTLSAIAKNFPDSVGTLPSEGAGPLTDFILHTCKMGLFVTSSFKSHLALNKS